MYEKLHTNIPAGLMEFTDQKFPKDAWLFPRRQTVQQYLVSYAAELRQLIKFCFQVSSVSLVQRQDDGRDGWRVEARSTVSDECFKGDFDAVVVANGHYSIPYIPSMANMAAFSKVYPSVISHSKHYRTPETFAGKKVIIVGNGPSGVDIALQINSVCKRPALLSVRHPTQTERLAHTGCREVPQIVEFLVEQRGVRLADDTIETDVDAVVFCTGFLFSFPFLQPELRSKLVTHGKGVHGLYKHLFSIQHPTMVFPGLNIKSVPWPVSEGQAAVFSAVWANRIALPDVAEMESWSRALEEQRGPALQTLEPLEDARYINELHGLVVAAGGGHGNVGVGKTPPYWDEEKFWERRIFADAKLRFEQQGCAAKTLEDLGLRYEQDGK
jgi:cation diffusion facilitator CzcD-associated flavoprotein CzcO